MKQTIVNEKKQRNLFHRKATNRLHKFKNRNNLKTNKYEENKNRFDSTYNSI
ncbi:hypothetical protein FLAV_00885 [Flavobacteriales bacterium]|nr:hypothetical protein FLAV_00885 [Flavobacteriales bacterium]